MSEENCVFCKIVKKEIPAEIIYEDGYVVVFMDISPASKGHLLIIPKKHRVMFHEMSNEGAEKMMKAARMITESMFNNVSDEGYNLVMNNGIHAGQEINHCHLHIIPRVKSDGINFHWNHVKYEEGEITKFSKKIRNGLFN